MAEDKKQEDKNRTLTEDRSINENNRRNVEHGNIKESVVRHDSTVTNTHKPPDPINKK